MYRKFSSLTQKPFERNPDPYFYDPTTRRNEVACWAELRRPENERAGAGRRGSLSRAARISSAVKPVQETDAEEVYGAWLE